ncbi:MAG: carboxymuconolactone decarboxylase family protein [Vicinamibacterales bacterium]
MRFRSVALCIGVLAGSMAGVLLLNEARLVAQERPVPATTKYVRLKTPRILPIEAKDYTPEQKAAVGTTNANLNFRTALYEPELGKRWWSWLTFVWSPEGRGDAALTLRDKELVILRTNWNCHDDWVWGRHVPIARREGRTDAEIQRIPKGPDAPGWSEKDRALLKAADELHTDQFITDATWTILTKYYNTAQMLDIIFMVGNYHLNAMYTNSVGMPMDGVDGMPADAHGQRPKPLAAKYVRLATPRIVPIEIKDFTPEQKAAVGDNKNPNLNFRSALYAPEFGKRWWSWLTFIWSPNGRGDHALTLHDKELVILRTNWNCNDDWVWGQHVPIAKREGRSDEDIARIPKGPAAAGWSEKDRALLKAADELHTDQFLTDATWKTLTTYYNTAQMIDLMFTVGNYHLNAMYTNSAGMPFQPGFGGLPARN